MTEKDGGNLAEAGEDRKNDTGKKSCWDKKYPMFKLLIQLMPEMGAQQWALDVNRWVATLTSKQLPPPTLFHLINQGK